MDNLACRCLQWLLGCMLLLVLIPCFAAKPARPMLHERPTAIMYGGWYHWDPYQYQIRSARSGVTQLTGLDIEFMRAFFGKLFITPQFQRIAWLEHQDALKIGALDFAAGMFYSPQRAQYYYFSKPYRLEENVLYVRRGESQKFAFDNFKQLMTLLHSHQFHLGVIRGYQYTDDKLNEFIADPQNAKVILKVDNETENFNNLFLYHIDGFFVDRVVGATIAWRNDWQNKVEEHPNFHGSKTIHVAFSKKTVSPEFVKTFNKQIDNAIQSGEHRRIITHYVFPILLAITTQQSWFFIIDIIGTIAFAISGVLIGRKESDSFVGTLILAALPAVGGGVIRDLMVSRSPIGVMRTPYYVYAVIFTVLISYLLMLIPRFVDLSSKGLTRFKQQAWVRVIASIEWIRVFDALGLAAFTVIGVIVAVEAKTTPLLLWGPILAALTSSGGGLLRDMVSGRQDISILKGELYAEVALLWGFIFAVFIRFETARLNLQEIFLAVVITLIGTYATRLMIIYFDIRGPMLKSRKNAVKF